jgi:hypothetical protein
MVAKIVEFFIHGIHWIGLMENLPAFLPSNIGVSCKFSHHPIGGVEERFRAPGIHIPSFSGGT